jgi:hypothetical protein
MTHEPADEFAQIYDLVIYKLRQKIKELPVRDMEVLMIERIIELYEEGIIFVSWDDKDLWVRMRDGTNVPKTLLFPEGDLLDD